MGTKKRNIKLIILVITLIIITSGISVYATSTYLASQVDYKNGNSVADALDDLYNKTKSYKNLNIETTASESDILSGKTAYNSNGNLITGNLENRISLSLFNNTEIAQFELSASLVSTYKKIKITSANIYSGNTCTYGICKVDGSNETAFTINQEYNIQSLYNSGYTKLYVRSNGWGAVTYELYN